MKPKQVFSGSLSSGLDKIKRIGIYVYFINSQSFFTLRAFAIRLLNSSDE